MSEFIDCIYRDGVFVPLEKVDFKEGMRLKIRIESSFDLSKYAGVLGKGSIGRLQRFEDEIHDDEIDL